MFTELMASGSGGGGYVFIDDYTNVECVAANNRSQGSSVQIKFNDIPKTQGVEYVMITQGATSAFNVGTKYNLKSFTNANPIIIDSNGNVTDLSSYNFTLSGTTLSSSQSSAYSNFGLFIIAEE